MSYTIKQILSELQSRQAKREKADHESLKKMTEDDLLNLLAMTHQDQ